MKDEKLTEAKNKEVKDTPKKGELTSESKGESTSETKGETKNTPKKRELTNRKYSTLLDAARENGVAVEKLKAEAVSRLKDVISTAYESIKRLHDSKTPVSDFIQMTRAEQSNKVLQISSGSLEQRLGYDRDTYTSVTTAQTPDEAVMYTLLACIGWDATARLCGIKDAPAAKTTKSSTNSTVMLNF